MPRNLTRSNQHWHKAVTRLPLGVASNFRYWGEERTIYVKQGRGARIEDIDGNRYVDYLLGLGPMILGHRPATVTAAVHRAIDEAGTCFALPTPPEADLAEKIVSIIGQR